MCSEKKRKIQNPPRNRFFLRFSDRFSSLVVRRTFTWTRLITLMGGCNSFTGVAERALTDSIFMRHAIIYLIENGASQYSLSGIKYCSRTRDETK